MEEKMRSISRPGAIAAAIAISLAATAAHADDDDIIRWKNIVGVITEKNFPIWWPISTAGHLRGPSGAATPAWT